MRASTSGEKTAGLSGARISHTRRIVCVCESSVPVSSGADDGLSGCREVGHLLRNVRPAPAGRRRRR
jgi:hypothetical protein